MSEASPGDSASRTTANPILEILESREYSTIFVARLKRRLPAVREEFVPTAWRR
jgi:hypothetical protein